MAPTRVPGVYVFLMVENSTRRIVHFNVTAHPTMEWTSRQLVEAFPWNSAPTCILRDRDSIHGRVFTAMVEVQKTGRSGSHRCSVDCTIGVSGRPPDCQIQRRME